MWQVLQLLGVDDVEWQVIRMKAALSSLESITETWIEALVVLATQPPGVHMGQMQQWLGRFIPGSGAFAALNGELLQ